MKNIIYRFQTTIKAIKLLSEPEVINKMYKEVKKSEQKSDLSRGQFIFHKHFIVQVI